MAPDVAYTWSAPSDGSFTFSTVGSSFDTLLELRTGSCTGPSLGCNDDSGGTVQSEVVVTLRRGMGVVVVVDGFGSSEGDFALNILRSEDVRPEDCRNGIDDDGDGAVDCEDGDCRDGLDCRPMFEDCFDGRDNDRDGLVDCEDGDCRRECDVREDCFDGRDDDGDGLTDCEDPDCRMFCVDELCGNGLDDDGNGLTDCADPFCEPAPECGPTGVCPDLVLGSMLGRVAEGSVSRATPSEREDASCGSRGAGPEVEFLWVAPAAGRYRISTEMPESGRGYDTVLSVRTGDCFGPELICDDDGGEGLLSRVELDLVEGQALFIVLESFRDEGGAYVLRIDALDTGG